MAPPALMPAFSLALSFSSPRANLAPITSAVAPFRPTCSRNLRARSPHTCTTAPEAPPPTQPAPADALRSTSVPFAPDWRVLGAPLSTGAVPAVLYFTLSATHSLDEAPYNEFAAALVARCASVRVFALTLPFHGRSLAQNAAAFSEWARVYTSGGDVVSRFSRTAAAFADDLVARGSPHQVASSPQAFPEAACSPHTSPCVQTAYVGSSLSPPSQFLRTSPSLAMGQCRVRMPAIAWLARACCSIALLQLWQLCRCVSTWVILTDVLGRGTLSN